MDQATDRGRLRAWYGSAGYQNHDAGRADHLYKGLSALQGAHP